MRHFSHLDGDHRYIVVAAPVERQVNQRATEGTDVGLGVGKFVIL